MAKQTRLATTLTSHLVAAAGAADAYYMDGRFSNPQKMKDADVSLDRTDEGFYLAIFAASDLNRESNRNYQQKRRSLDRICELIKDESRGNIDNVINDMAENAVHVAGRLGLEAEEQRLPYFSGVLVRDAEMAAVTLGSGVAYLYRDDALYPLTQDEFTMEAIDASGNPVENFEIYAAGRAGTIRYSNISQLQVDDCVLLTTKEVMETVGQKKLLQLLDEAYDQQEATELVSAIMEEQNPDQAYQFMMTFVEDILLPSRRRRGDTGIHRALTQTVSETAMTDATTRFSPDEISKADENTAATQFPVSGSSADALAAAKTAGAVASSELAAGVGDETARSAAVAAAVAAASAGQVGRNAENAPSQEAEISPWSKAQAGSTASAQQAAAHSVSSNLQEDSITDESPFATVPSSKRADTSVEPFIDENQGRKGRRRLFVLFIVILLGLAFIAAGMLLRRKGLLPGGRPAYTTGTTEATAVTTEPTTVVSTTHPTTESTTTSSQETTDTDASNDEQTKGTKLGKNGGSYPVSYEVRPNDNFTIIIYEVYSNYDLSELTADQMNEIISRFVSLNPDTISGTVEADDVMLYAESVIKVPDVSDILQVKQ